MALLWWRSCRSSVLPPLLCRPFLVLPEGHTTLRKNQVLIGEGTPNWVKTTNAHREQETHMFTDWLCTHFALLPLLLCHFQNLPGRESQRLWPADSNRLTQLSWMQNPAGRY